MKRVLLLSFFLIDCFFFCVCVHSERRTSAMFWRKKSLRELSEAELEKTAAKRHLGAKKELARRLMKGEGVEKNEVKAVSFLEDCATLGDADAMLMLAKCYVFGRGREQNVKRAMVLVSDSAKNKNEEALSLMELANNWNDKNVMDMTGSF